MKRLKAIIISMVIILLSVIIISETQATNKGKKAVYQTSTRSVEGYAYNAFGDCIIHICNTDRSEDLEPGVFPYGSSGYNHFELAYVNGAWEIVSYYPIQRCEIY